MPYTDDLNQADVVFASVNNSIWTNGYLVEIWLIELGNDSPHPRILLQHLDACNDSVAELFSSLRTVSRNSFYQAM